MEKKKVLHIVESFGSGVFSFLVDLVNATDKEFDITIAYGVRKETLENFESYFSDKVTFIKVENFTRSINPVKDVKAFFEVKKIIKKINPDVIHLHSSKAGFIGRFAANGKKVKMLYNPHGFSFLMKNSSKIKRTFYWLLEKIGSFRKCIIVGCSQGEYEQALRLTQNAICINNGIDLENLNSITKDFVKNEVNFENLSFCTIGRIGYQKNPKMFNEIAELFPDKKFTWIGDGDFRSELKSPNIEITGWVKREEVLEILNSHDVFLLTSFWEGLPISLLEAMYLKKICIVSDCIGNRDVVKNGKNGFIIKKINKETIEKILIEAKSNYTMIVDNQINDIREKYTIKIMCEKYKKEYEG